MEYVLFLMHMPLSKPIASSLEGNQGLISVIDCTKHVLYSDTHCVVIVYRAAEQSSIGGTDHWSVFKCSVIQALTWVQDELVRYSNAQYCGVIILSNSVLPDLAICDEFGYWSILAAFLATLKNLAYIQF